MVQLDIRKVHYKEISINTIFHLPEASPAHHDILRVADVPHRQEMEVYRPCKEHSACTLE